ncbi:MAG: hypothetical protein IJ520_02470 [Synergistaceae bacterium]|nr:hypothetical protein [Synergistaceae bacterium]
MAAVATLKSSKASFKLNAGQTESGKAITKTDTLPSLVQDVAAADIISLRDAAAPILAYPIGSIEHAVVTVITDE